MMAKDAAEVYHQLTFRRPTWPFDDWRYEVLTRCSEGNPSTEDERCVWYTPEECKTIADVLKADSTKEDYPFRKQRLAAVMSKTLANSKRTSSKTLGKSTRSRLSNMSRDVYSLDKVALGHKFFHVLVNMMIPEYQDEIYQQRADIVDILQGTGKYLRQNSDLFSECSLALNGLLADGVDIYSAHEADLLIVLPLLAETVKEAEICDESDLIPVLHLTLNEDKKETNLLKRLETDLEEALGKSMKTDWKLESTCYSSDSRSLKVDLKYRAGEKDEVSTAIYLAFVVPVEKTCLSMKGDESHPDKIAKVPLQNYSFSFLKERDSRLTAILSDDELKTCNLSLEQELTSVLNDDIKGTGVAHTYHLAKRTVAAFFPQVFQNGAWKPIVPSPVLLNIVLYLCAYRKTAKLWTSPRMYERLVEVLFILERCAEDEAVNLFFLPGMMALPLFTSNAYYFNAKQSKFLCSEDGYSTEKFDCRLLDKSVLAIFNKHPDLTTYLVPYFSKMRNNDWTFPDKLEELILMLQDIFQRSVPGMWNDGRMSSIETDTGLAPPAEKRRVSVRQTRQKTKPVTFERPLPQSKPSKSSDSSLSSRTSKSSLKQPVVAKPASSVKITTQTETTTTTQKRMSVASSTSNGVARRVSKRAEGRRTNCCPVQ